jgi:hypothetical protein
MANRVLIGIFGTLAIAIAGCSTRSSSNGCGSEIIAAQAIDQAEAAETAESALEALRDGDTTGAVAVLEGQLRGSMLILHSAQPRLVSNKGLTPQQRQMIDQVISNGDSYLGKKQKR